jgi:Tol biopolymer transport system component
MKYSKKYSPFVTICLFLLVALSVQGCSGIGNNGPSGTTITTNAGGKQVTVAQNLFKGKIYLTIDHNLWVITGNGKNTELLRSGDIYDPAVSPDGKWIAYIEKFKNYSNLDVIPANGGPVRVLKSGNGRFYIDTGIAKNTFFWFMQPEWSPDGSRILFLSDLQKNFVWADLNSLFGNNYFLDLQVFSIPFNNPSATPQVLAYASFGDGGDADASYQPSNSSGVQQIAYTHYAYDAQTGTQQVVRIFLADANAIANHPGQYTPLQDSGVALTPPAVQNIQPAFSPDGKAIAYIRRESVTQMGLWIMATPPSSVTATPNDPTTAKQAMSVYFASTRILGNLYLSQPVWSPDGKQIAFFQYTNSEYDLWVTNVKYDAKTGKYAIQGNPQQLSTGGVDGGSRAVWTN